MRVLVAMAVTAFLSGCGRAYYRRDADRESYAAIAEHMNHPQWALPRTSIDPPPASRLFDPFDPDHPPMPPDDPAANRYMRCMDGIKGSKRWHKDGDAPWIEDPRWRESLRLPPDGKLVLTPERAVELGVLNSREYQSALEDLYFTALVLTLERFEFDLHWFGLNNTSFTHFGSGANESNTLTTSSQLGFTRALAAGGQLLVDFANTFVWEFAGPDSTTASSNIAVTLIQPLLRRAGRQTRLEPLTQAERNLLYAVRDFARFRKVFYVNVTTQAGGFLSLLSQTQNIRNLQANLASLEQNLRMHEALFEAGTVSSVQLDQVFQSVQQARVQLLRAQTDLDTALDEFKTTLGLPPNIPVSLDDSLLAPFQLNDPALGELQGEIDTVFAEYRQLRQAPPLAKLQEGLNKLRTFRGRIRIVADEVHGELNRWRTRLAEPAQDPKRAQRERATYDLVFKELAEANQDQFTLAADLDKAAAALQEDKRTEGWEVLQKRTRQEIALAAQLFVIQTQIRVYLIQLEPVRVNLDWATLDWAIDYALSNRLDLMNQEARVVDAWRLITVTANQLKSDLDVVLNANIATKPGGSNPFDFRASASSYSAGVLFAGPLNREAERNEYRASLIVYERSRRAYMALDDQIQKAIRRDLRLLEAERANFEIAQDSLAGAAREIEAARQRALVIENAADTTTTQDILVALNNLLTAKSILLSSWVNYETNRVQLLLDMEALELDERGISTNDHHESTAQSSADVRDPSNENPTARAAGHTPTGPNPP